MPYLNAADARARSDLPMWTWADADGPETALQQAIADLGAGTARKVAVDETMRADFALWPVTHPAEIVYWLGDIPAALWVGGKAWVAPILPG